VSDVGILNSPGSVIFILLIFGSPGFVLGVILGALLWRRHRIAGAFLGAVVGFIVWLVGWMAFKGMI
jgi:Na+/proline symporter